MTDHRRASDWPLPPVLAGPESAREHLANCISILELGDLTEATKNAALDRLRRALEMLRG